MGLAQNWKFGVQMAYMGQTDVHNCCKYPYDGVANVFLKKNRALDALLVVEMKGGDAHLM